MRRTRVKSTTLIITLLSILLVLSLATSVALAYFSTSKTVTSTITFAGGVDVDVFDSSNNGTTWNVTALAFTSGQATWTNTATGESPTKGFKFKALGVKIASSAGANEAYIAVKPSIKVGGDSEYISTMPSGWKSVPSKAGWYILTTSGSDNVATLEGATKINKTTEQIMIKDVTIDRYPNTAGAADDNSLAGKAVVATLKIVAVDTSATWEEFTNLMD